MTKAREKMPKVFDYDGDGDCGVEFGDAKPDSQTQVRKNLWHNTQTFMFKYRLKNTNIFLILKSASTLDFYTFLFIILHALTLAIYHFTV